MDKPSYTIIKTEDGSDSLYAEEYQEAMHTISGAYQEALIKHVYPSRLLEKQGNSPLCVLDVGFGLGYNSLALMAEFSTKFPSRPLSIYALEKSSHLTRFIESISFNDHRDRFYKRFPDLFRDGVLNIGPISCHLLIGDARKTLASIQSMSFDAVFFDPFSPSKNPELWTREFLSLVKRCMNETAILTTYSSSKHIRKAMLQAGFCIAKAPSLKPKKEGTIASPAELHNAMSDDEKAKLLSNNSIIPYTDPNLDDKPESIAARRQGLMADNNKMM